MNNLHVTIEYQRKGNIDMFVKNGGSDSQAFEKVYKVLINLPCIVLFSEIVIYKQVNSHTIDVNKLHVKAREKYQTLVTNKTWKKTSL